MKDGRISIVFDAWRAKRQGREALAARQKSRLAEMVAYARAHSPLYAELYRDLPDRIEDPRQLPVTDKKMLMERFDEWCTDRTVTLEAAEALIDAEAGMNRMLAEHGLEQVTLGRGGEPPEQGRGGKFREVIPLAPGRGSSIDEGKSSQGERS